MKALAFKFHKLLGRCDTFKASEGWLWRWKAHRRIFCISLEGESTVCDSKAAEKFLEILLEVTEDDEYTDEQLYSCDETALDYKLFPDKSLDVKSVPNKAGMKTNRK